MVKIITDEVELRKYVHEDTEWNERSGYIIRLTLTADKIEEFKQKGYFAHIKKELGIMHKVMFACTENKEGTCTYYFISPTEALMDRIADMVYSLYYDNVKVPLVKCTTPRCIGGIKGIDGQLKSCNLF